MTWELLPLKGKYYGTEIRITPRLVVKVWGERIGQISPREEDYEDVMCDGHYEDMGDYRIARLIAAAPDLLAELERLLAEWDAERIEWVENRYGVMTLNEKQGPTGGDFFQAARAAIKKAKGQ